MSEFVKALEERHAQLRANRETLFAQLQATAGAIGEIERLMAQAQEAAASAPEAVEAVREPDVTPPVNGRKSRRQ